MKTLVTTLLVVLLIALQSAFGQFTWTKDTANPVLSGSGNGTWDKHVFMPCVLFNADSGRYEMWYGGSYGPEVSWRPYRMGFAWSTDGVNWTKYAGNPVLSPSSGTWDEGTVEGPSVVRENGQYKMWYTGLRGSVAQIGHATSPDGIHWTKHAGNPVLSPGSAAWEVGGVAYCSVISSLGTYKAWYGGIDVSLSIQKIGRATSLDGINWQKDTVNNPVLTTGTSGQWDDRSVLQPNVLIMNNMYYMWYTGWRSGTRQVGIATSTNGGISWTKHALNPILVPSPGSWDATYVEGGTVMLRDSVFHTWYDGSTVPTASNLYKIGHATSPRIQTAVEGSNNDVPNGFVLQQNYPNPFNPSTNIKYQIPNTNHVTLKVFDILGREVATIVNEVQEVGYRSVQFDARNLSGGVYVYRLQTGAFVEAKKLILLR